MKVVLEEVEGQVDLKVLGDASYSKAVVLNLFLLAYPKKKKENLSTPSEL